MAKATAEVNKHELTLARTTAPCAVPLLAFLEFVREPWGPPHIPQWPFLILPNLLFVRGCIMNDHRHRQNLPRAFPVVLLQP